MSDSEDRPRPRYGEYATPEQQAAGIRQPAPTPPVPVGPPVPPGAAAPRVRAAPGTAGLVNRILTIVLLGYGLINVLSQVTQFLDYGKFSDSLLTLLGVSARLPDPSVGQAWGTTAAIFVALAWLGTVALCLLRLQRGRSAWWIALVAGVVAQIVVAILISVPLYADPTMRAALVGMSL